MLHRSVKRMICNPAARREGGKKGVTWRFRQAPRSSAENWAGRSVRFLTPQEVTAAITGWHSPRPVLLTIRPNLLDQLEKTDGTGERTLHLEKVRASMGNRLHLDYNTFRWMHNKDAMATGMLIQGTRKFNADARRMQEYALEVSFAGSESGR